MNTPPAGWLREVQTYLDLADGGVVVLVDHADDARLSELGRHLLRDRSLKVVVWSPEELTRKMARRAPDLYDWISHRVLCPPDGVSTVARAGLLSARSAGVPVAWGGARGRCAVRCGSCGPTCGCTRSPPLACCTESSCKSFARTTAPS